VVLNLSGIRLLADGDRLRFHPRSAVTPDFAEGLKACKSDWLALLQPMPETVPVVTVDP
jgi:hypothetical protein